MTDAVKMAIDALTDIRTSIECAAGCDEGIDPMAAVSEIMSAYGTAMASAYSRAADMVNILAALEQAGEPVADDWGTPPDPDGHMSKNAVVEALDMMVEHWVQGTRPTDEQGRQATAALMSLNREPPLPTLQRLGQEFDAGEADSSKTCLTCNGFGLARGGACWNCKGSGKERGEAVHPDTARLDALRDECWDLRSFSVPTGGDDADVAWKVVGHWMAEPQERTIAEGWSHDPRVAIDAALATPPQPDPQSHGQAFDGELPLKFDPRDAKRWWEENMKESKFVSARLAGDGYVKFHWRDEDESGDYSVPWTRIALWLAASKSRGQALDGEGEAAALRIGWWNDMRRRGVSQENAILAINAALSSAKRGKGEG